LDSKGRENNGGVNAPGAFLACFFGGHLPQTSGFRSAKEILIVSFATQPRAFILSERNIFYTPREGGRTTAGSNAPGAFLVLTLFCLGWVGGGAHCARADFNDYNSQTAQRIITKSGEFS